MGFADRPESEVRSSHGRRSCAWECWGSTRARHEVLRRPRAAVSEIRYQDGARGLARGPRGAVVARAVRAHFGTVRVGVGPPGATT